MKLKNVYSIIAVIFLIVGVALWKLNATYRAEKIALGQNQLQTQLTALRSSLVSQISQLRNILSAYSVQIDESKINWIQLKPFYVLAIVQEDSQNRLTINKLFAQSGTVAERWNSVGLQQNLSARVSGNQLLRTQVFKDSNELKHLALVVFDREKRNNQSRNGIMVVGDVSYFQRFFDLQRTSGVTQVLLTSDKTVAAHSEYDYVGNLSEEGGISQDLFFIDKQEMRGANLTLLSYASKKANSYLDIPLPILGIIIGLGFIMSGILLFVVKPSKEISTQPASSKLISPSEIAVTESAVTAAQIGKPVSAIKNEIPLVLDQESQVVPIQIQACVQQALFNIERQLKKNSININKEFVSWETLSLDYPRFVKIFENILLNVERGLAANKRKIFLRSYDIGSLTVLEVQAPVSRFVLNNQIEPELQKNGAEFTRTTSSAGDLILKFTFFRQEKNADQLPPIPRSKTPVIDSVVVPVALPLPETSQDLDIDAILSLDDETEAKSATTVKLDLAKEMQPAKFKLEDKMAVVENPEINIELSDKKQVEQIKVKIRRPEKG